MYKLTIKKEALKELEHLPKRIVITVYNAIDQLAINPRPIGCKKLKSTKENLWRIRVGDYRVIYLVDDVIRIVNVRKIGHRKDIYD
jgi:mRNA interferase RelE/StbE